MKITAVRAAWLRAVIPAERAHRSDFGLNDSFNTCLVEIDTDTGHTGLGEAKVGVGNLGNYAAIVTLIHAELAGVDPNHVALEIRGRRLIIAGERRGSDTTNCFYQQVEIEHGPFRREIELGTEVDAARARATYDNGILRVEVPVKAPEEQVRSIPVTSRAREPGNGR